MSKDLLGSGKSRVKECGQDEFRVRGCNKATEA